MKSVSNLLYCIIWSAVLVAEVSSVSAEQAPSARQTIEWLDKNKDFWTRQWKNSKGELFNIRITNVSMQTPGILIIRESLEQGSIYAALTWKVDLSAVELMSSDNGKPLFKATRGGGILRQADDNPEISDTSYLWEVSDPEWATRAYKALARLVELYPNKGDNLFR